MLNDFINPKFEIEITDRNGRVEAFCPVFPECFGIGGSENEAIEDLADSIALYLGDVVKGTVTDIIRGGVLRRVDPVKEIKNKLNDKIQKDENKVKKSTFIFPGNLKGDVAKIEKLFSNHPNSKPIVKGGLLSIIGLPQVNMERKGQGISPKFINNNFPEHIDNAIDFYEQYGMEEIRGPEGILIGIPLSFN